jgi:excinuclease ABC subunit A
MKDVLAQAVQIELELGGKKADFDSITFPKKLIQNIEMIDQNPIGKSSVPIL